MTKGTKRTEEKQQPAEEKSGTGSSERGMFQIGTPGVDAAIRDYLKKPRNDD